MIYISCYNGRHGGALAVTPLVTTSVASRLHSLAIERFKGSTCELRKGCSVFSWTLNELRDELER